MSASEAHVTPERIQELEDYVLSYTSAPFTIHRPSAPAPSSEVVFVTGTTGGFGCAMLTHLVTLPTVSRIYAFNRKDTRGRPLRQRQAESLVGRNLDPRILDSPKIVMVEGDSSVPGLGVSPSLYAEMRDSMTLIIHNAWRINFLQKIASFEPLIRGVRVMVDFALESPHPSPPRLIFPSSIIAYMNWPVEVLPERHIPDAHVAVGVGYGESKWVSERIVQIASERTPLRPLSVRLGQLSCVGDSAWDDDTWLPRQVASGVHLGVIASGLSTLPLLRTDIAAEAIIAFRHSPLTTHNLVHPRPMAHGTFTRVIAELFGVTRTVSVAKWVELLEESGEGVTDPKTAMHNPALHLLPFWRFMAERMSHIGKDEMGLPIFAMDEALKVAPVLREENLPTTTEAEMRGWLRAWKRDGIVRVPDTSASKGSSHGMDTAVVRAKL